MTSSLPYPIHIGDNSLHALASFLENGQYSSLMVLMDEHTSRDCYPLVTPFLPDHFTTILPPGEQYKHLQSCETVWEKMTIAQMDRKALVINLGGGVIGDLGGFVAGTYKRGIDFVQVPTTLLAQVDASVGGKVGVDFQHYKNHIGLFATPRGVYIWPAFLATLPQRELISGFAEAIKHHLIADQEGWAQLQKHDSMETLDLEGLIEHSVEIKADIVAADIRENGARKALNFGHTIGHAIESEYLHRPDPLLHGEAIAIGMIAEAWLSMQLGYLASGKLEQISTFILNFFPKVSLSTADFPSFYQRMLHDKKNLEGRIQFSLIEGPGKYRIEEEVSKTIIFEALAYYKDIP